MKEVFVFSKEEMAPMQPQFMIKKKKPKSNSRKVKDPKMSQLCRRKVKNLWGKNHQKQKTKHGNCLRMFAYLR